MVFISESASSATLAIWSINNWQTSRKNHCELSVEAAKTKGGWGKQKKIFSIVCAENPEIEESRI